MAARARSRQPDQTPFIKVWEVRMSAACPGATSGAPGPDGSGPNIKVTILIFIYSMMDWWLPCVFRYCVNMNERCLITLPFNKRCEYCKRDLREMGYLK